MGISSYPFACRPLLAAQARCGSFVQRSFTSPIAMKMHAGEVAIDTALVAQLVAAQFPRFADLPIRESLPAGTVNAVFRLGDELCARLPRHETWVPVLLREWRCLRGLAPKLPLAIPQPVARGRPSATYPYDWAIYRWLDGAQYADELVDDEIDAAQDLARFVIELRGADRSGAPPAGRKPLAELDQMTRRALERAGEMIDRRETEAAWRRALEAPAWDGLPVWIHADLLRPNLLVRDGRLRAVIDFGSAGVGDPAADVVAAWSVFGPAGCAAYRESLQVDAGTWCRARGYALHQALLIIPYYARTNPAFVGQATRTVGRVLADRS